MILSTTWTKAFGGTGGEDSLLFQIVSYALLAFVAVGALALAVAIRPRRGLGTALAAAMITIGILLTLFLLYWLGLPEIVLAVIVLVMRPRLPGGTRRGPPRWAFVGAAAFNLFFGIIGFYTVGIPVFTGRDVGGLPPLLGAASVLILAIGVVSVALAIRPLRLPALIVGVALLACGVGLLLIVVPLGLIEMALGALALNSWRKLRAMPPRPPPIGPRGP